MQSPWYTPQTASEALRSLRAPAEAICRAWRILDSSRPAAFPGDAPVDRAYFVLCRALRSALIRFDRAGVIVSDGRNGRFEFPARRNGRPVRLCWTLGERAPGSWRETEGDGETRPLDDGPWDQPPAALAG